MRCRPRGDTHCTERRRGSAGRLSSAIFFAGCGGLFYAALHQAAVFEHRVAVHLFVLAALHPAGLHAKLREISRGLRERGERNAQLRLEAVLEQAFAVVLAVVIPIGIPHHQPAQALAEVLQAPDAGDANHGGEQGRHRSVRRGQASYLNDSASRARNCVILPSSIFTSSLLISAMRRSRSDFEATFTALRAASSQELVLVPITSVTR